METAMFLVCLTCYSVKRDITGATNKHNVKQRVKGLQLKFILDTNMELVSHWVEIPYPKPLFRHL
jgi:hypothetical protein